MKRRWLLPAALGGVLVFGLACGGLPLTSGEAALDELPPPESPFTWALIMSWMALTLGGGSAILGIWIDRDRARPVTFALMLSVLIFTAVCVGGLQGYLDEEGAITTRADLERMLDMVDDIAAQSGDPELAALVDGQAKRRRGPRAARAVPPPVEVPPEVPSEPAPTDAVAPEAPAPEEVPPTEGAAPAEGGG